jgi:hypothetical protein
MKVAREGAFWPVRCLLFRYLLQAHQILGFRNRLQPQIEYGQEENRGVTETSFFVTGTY